VTSLPILDNHVHLDPKGRNIEAAKDFEKAGGTHLILVHLPYDEVPIADLADFERSYDITIRMADRVRNETKLGVDVVLGPHPVLIMEMLRKMSLAEAIEVMKDGMEAAQRLVLEKKAVAIGEIGRPHFPVDPEVLEAFQDGAVGAAEIEDGPGREFGRDIRHHPLVLVDDEAPDPRPLVVAVFDDLPLQPVEIGLLPDDEKPALFRPGAVAADLVAVRPLILDGEELDIVVDVVPDDLEDVLGRLHDVEEEGHARVAGAEELELMSFSFRVRVAAQHLPEDVIEEVFVG